MSSSTRSLSRRTCSTGSRVIEYHESTKHTHDEVRQNPHKPTRPTSRTSFASSRDPARSPLPQRAARPAGADAQPDGAGLRRAAGRIARAAATGSEDARHVAALRRRHRQPQADWSRRPSSPAPAPATGTRSRARSTSPPSRSTGSSPASITTARASSPCESSAAARDARPADARPAGPGVSQDRPAARCSSRRSSAARRGASASAATATRCTTPATSSRTSSPSRRAWACRR